MTELEASSALSVTYIYIYIYSREESSFNIIVENIGVRKNCARFLKPLLVFSVSFACIAEDHC
jgi:hypothetical protein